MKDRYYPIALIVVFIGMLVIPLRTLALDPNAIESAFYTRGRLITLIADLRYSLGDRVYPSALVGENGWLVYTAEGDIEDYQRSRLLTEDELTRFQQNLDALSTKYAERGITLLVIVPPNKNSIYPERVPSQIPVLGNVTKLDQVVAYLRTHGQTQVIDLRPALIAAKAEHQTYFATDTHWNEYGAYIAYSALMTELNKVYPNLTAHPISDFKIVKREPEQLDLSKNMGITLLPESKIQFLPRFDLHTKYKNVNLGQRKLMFSYNPDGTLPNLVMYYDSFFFNVLPLLGEHFHKGYYIQNYTGGGLWNLSWVDEQDPDVVIIEFSERYLDDLPRFIDPNK
jgi:alginate O-acetyltransferase complex protein AlgJ